MKTYGRPLDRRAFLKKATQAAATMAVSAGVGSVAAPLLASRRGGLSGRPPDILFL